MKKNGFIATSIMYSFFAVFSMVALIILATYTHYRVLINNINNNVLTELNAKIADKYTTIYNLLNNGDFEEDSAWNYVNTTKIEKNVPYGSSYSGTYSARMPKNDASFNQSFSIKDKVDVDNKYHKVYVAFRVFRNGPVTGTGTITLNASGKDYAINGSSLIGGFSNWTLYSEIVDVGMTNDNDWTLNFNISGNTKDNYTFIDNAMVVDIKNVYNGNTTPDSDMKSYLDTYLDYFNGSYVMTKYGNGVSTNEEVITPDPVVIPDPEPTCVYTPNQTFEFNYTGGEQTFTPECNGYYKFEAWGAQGGNSNSTGGYGSYSEGIINLTANQKLYINVGGAGATNSGGYNGGGNTSYSAGGGGGATQVATQTGKLASLSRTIGTYSSTLLTYDSQVIMIVAGGGGGAGSFVTNPGGAAGGYLGNNGGGSCAGLGGSQTAGGLHSASMSGTTSTYGGNGGFGSGGNGGSESAFSNGSGAGGSGFFGGAGGSSRDGSGGGGSGYIGSSSLISTGGFTKHMTCYNCTTSNNSATATNTTTNVSATPTSDYTKSGNGYVRITYVVIVT